MSASPTPKTPHFLHPFMFLLVLALPLLPYIGMQVSLLSNHPDVGAWWGAFCFIVAAPLLEQIIGIDPFDAARGQTDIFSYRLCYRLLVVMVLPLQLFLLLYGAHIFSSNEPVSLAGKIGWVLSCGLCSGVLCYIVGHEIIHKYNSVEKFIGTSLLATVCNTGFKIDHIKRHHAHLATSRDTYSALLNQSLYSFLCKVFVCSLSNPWELETYRLSQKGYGRFHMRNRLLTGSAVSIGLAFMFYLLFNLSGVVFFIAQSGIAFIALQVVNYIQHYGLPRREVSPEKFEPPSHTHTWNCNYLWCNIFFLNLPRHPDHHHYPGRYYYLLRSNNESPQMPFGYALMILMAFVPPLWFRIVNPRVMVYQEARRESDSSSLTEAAILEKGEKTNH